MIDSRSTGVRPAALAALLGAAVLLWPQLGPAQESSRELPSPAQFQSFLSSVEGPWSGLRGAESCTFVADAADCACWRAPGSQAEEWRRSPAGVEAAGVGATTEAGRWHAGRLSTAKAEAWEVLFVARPEQGQARPRALGAARIRLEGGNLVLEEVSFGRLASPLPEGEANSCAPRAPRLAAVEASAERVVTDGTTFRIEGLSQGWWSGTVGPEGSDGVLPPVLRGAGGTDDLAAGVSASYLHAASGLGLVLDAAPGTAYGAGLALITEGFDGPRWFEAQAQYDESQDELRPFAVGRLSLGDGRGGLSASVEHPSSEAVWRLRRLEAGAFFRDWRRTSVGASLSGPSHGLQLEAATEGGLDGEPERWFAATRYGTEIDTGSWGRVSVDLEQVSDVTGDDSTHSTTAVTGLFVPFGHRGRFFFEPGLVVAGNYGVIPAERGFESSASGAVLARADTSLAFAGRYVAATHRIRPRVQVGAELFGIAQRPTLAPTAPRFLFTRREGWTYGVASLEQTLELGGLTFRLPLRLLTSTVELEDPVEHTSLVAEFGISDAHLGVDLVWLSAGRGLEEEVVDDEEQEGMASIWWRGRSFGARLASARLAADSGALLALDAALDSPLATLFLSQPGFTARPRGDEVVEAQWGHLVALHARFAGITGVASGRWAPEEPAASGVGVELRRRLVWPGLGLRLAGGLRPHDEEWAVSAGLYLPAR